MKHIFKEYWQVVLMKKWAFVICVLSVASATTLDFYSPVFYQHIANALAQPFSESLWQTLLDNFLMLVLFYSGVWLSWRVLEFAIIPLDGGGMNLLEKRCFEVLKQQRYGFFENRFSGSLIKQVNRFVRAYEIIMDWFLFQFLFNVLAITVSSIIFYHQHKTFAFYFLIWVVIFICWNIFFSIWKMKFDKSAAEADSTVGGRYSDAISNIFILKSFALEEKEQQKINHSADILYRKRTIAWIMEFISFAVQGLLTFGIELLLVYLMILKWREGNFAIGEFVLFQSILLLLIHKLWEFGRNLRQFFTALADASEMADVFEIVDIERDAPETQDQPIKQGKIEFKAVDFSYSGNPEEKLFDELNLTIQPGEKVALVGHSGSGKTTLTKLLFRFCEPQSGNILFDGMDANSFTLHSLRSQISLVPQQPELFHRSIAENIHLGSEVSDEALKDAAHKARCQEFIENLPNQFDTLVGERGVKLSGGERQRVALARAFLKNSPIVVLDEATSALDSLTEQQIQIAIFELIADKTAIVIAHRLSTILRMDRIIVFENGKILEQGKHQQLLEQKGIYHDMWQHQQGNFLGK